MKTVGGKLFFYTGNSADNFQNIYVPENRLMSVEDEQFLHYGHDPKAQTIDIFLCSLHSLFDDLMTYDTLLAKPRYLISWALLLVTLQVAQKGHKHTHTHTHLARLLG